MTSTPNEHAGATGGNGPGAGGAGPTAGTGPDTGMDAVWAAVRRLGITRSRDDRWFGGVCAGTADRLGVDPVVIRVAVIALALMGGVGVVAYAVAWLLLPDHTGRIEARQLMVGDVAPAAVAAIALVVAGVLVPNPWTWWNGGRLVDSGDVVAVLVLSVLAVLGLTWLARRGAADSAAPAAFTAPAPSAAFTRPAASAAPEATAVPAAAHTGCGARRRRGPGSAITTATAGLALVAAGVTWLAAATGWLGARAAHGTEQLVLAACAALAVVALALVGLGLAGRRDGAVGFFGVVLLGTTIALATVPSWQTVRVVGDAAWRPTTLTAAEQGWTLGAGDAVLDLRELPGLDRPGDAVHIPVRMGFGNLRIEVPSGADVTVRSRVLLGSAGPASGVAVDRTSSTGTTGSTGTASARPVVVDARSLIGQITVETVER
jgi:phage shock protein PspC (stress-responsive transcriptional regulator)